MVRKFLEIPEGGWGGLGRPAVRSGPGVVEVLVSVLVPVCPLDTRKEVRRRDCGQSFGWWTFSKLTGAPGSPFSKNP